MKRKGIGRGWRLSLRMAIVMVLLAVVYVGIGAGLVALYEAEPSWGVYIGLISAAVLAAVVYQFMRAGDILLRSARVSRRPTPRLADIQARVARQAALAEMPVPRCAVAETNDANAFAVGVSKKQATLVVTDGLCDLLNDTELDAVIAHELAHIANRDSAVMTLASVPRSIGAVLTSAGQDGLFLFWWLGVVPYWLGTLLTLALSRCREFAADRGSAVITGRPETLMSALSKMAKETPAGDLRTVEALCTVSAVPKRPEFLLDHPPLAKRIAQLSEIQREIGAPARPIMADA